MKKQQFEIACELSGVGVWEWSIESDINTINDEWANMLGYRKVELEPVTLQSFLELIHPSDSNAVQQEIQRHIEGLSDAFSVTFRMKHKEGNWVMVHARGAISERVDNRPTKMSGVHIDVHKIMDKMSIHQGTSRQLSQTLRNAPVVLFSRELEPPYRFNYLSNELQHVFALDSESIEQLQSSLSDRKQAIETQQRLHQFVSLPLQSFSGIWSLTDIDGNTVLLQEHSSKLMQNGQVTAITGALSDITETQNTNQLLTEIAAMIPGMVYQYVWRNNGHTQFTYASAKIADIYGVTPEQACADASQVFAVIHPDDVAKVQQSIEASATALTPWNAMYRVIRDNQIRWVHGMSQPHQASSGDIFWNGVIMEVTEQKEIEHELIEARYYLELVNQTAHVTHWKEYYEEERTKIVAPPALFDMLGMPTRNDYSSKSLLRQSAAPQSIEKLEHALTASESNGKIDVVYQLKKGCESHSSGRWVHVLADYHAYNGKHVLVGTARDITKEKELELELVRKSTHDGLTSIFNRSYFVEMGTEAIERAFRHDSPLSLISFDLDFFKRINDNFGHANGDVVLIEVTKAIAALLRGSDIFARIGGEEFSILAERTTIEQALQLANKLRENVERIPFELNGQQITVTASFGVTALSGHADNLDAMLQRSDEALYIAKHNGRNRVEVLFNTDVGLVG